MAQQVKDPVLSLLWLRSPLGHGFDPWPRNLHMPTGTAKKKKKKKKKRETEREEKCTEIDSPCMFVEHVQLKNIS